MTPKIISQSIIFQFISYFSLNLYFTIFILSTAIKYLNRTLLTMKDRTVDSDEDVGILDEILMRGLPPIEAIPLVVDMLMAGIDTVIHLNYYSFP